MWFKYLSNNVWRDYLLTMSASAMRHPATIIRPFRVRRASSVPLGKGTKLALHHGEMSTTKYRAIQILHISMFMFTYKCEYCNGLNVALPTYFTSNIYAAYQRQINSQFFVTQPGIEPGTHG